MKIAILGSRDISVKILEWIIKQNNCEIVGVVAPTYKTWWNDKLKETAIVVSHRLSALNFCDKVYMIQNKTIKVLKNNQIKKFF